MKPSFLTSTLSLAFILSVVSVIAMIFMQIEVDEKLLSVLTGIVTAYAASRNPSQSSPEHANTEVITVNKTLE